MSSDPELLAVLCDPFLLADEAISRVTDDDDDDMVGFVPGDDWEPYCRPAGE